MLVSVCTTLVAAVWAAVPASAPTCTSAGFPHPAVGSVHTDMPARNKEREVGNTKVEQVFTHLSKT